MCHLRFIVFVPYHAAPWSEYYYDARDRRSHHTRTKQRAQEEKVSWSWEQIKEEKISWNWEEIMGYTKAFLGSRRRERREDSDDAGVRGHIESPKGACYQSDAT